MRARDEQRQVELFAKSGFSPESVCVSKVDTEQTHFPLPHRILPT